MKHRLKMMLCYVFVSCLIFAIIQTSAAASSLVATDNVNVRSGPSLNDNVIASVVMGASVEILEHDPAGWSKVRASGTTGYIRSDFLAVPAGAQSRSLKTTDGVNFRTAPSLDADVIRTIVAGTSVEILEHDPAGWSEVKVGNEEGYIRSDFLALSVSSSGASSNETAASSGNSAASGNPSASNAAPPPAASTAPTQGSDSGTVILKTNDGVNFRYGPSTDTGIIMTLNVNTSVEVLERDLDGWSKVIFEGTVGYIRSDFLSVTGRYIELLEWSVVRPLIQNGTAIRVYDVRTGITFNIKCFSKGDHADVEPITKADTAAHLRSHNGIRSWAARPVWVTIGDRTIAASLHGMPHDVSTIPDNDMNGHLCLHFLGSTTSSTSASYKADLQNAVKEAWDSR